MTICPGCGVSLPPAKLPASAKLNASPECMKFFHELSYYTLSLRDPEFLHQIAVDAYAAQHGGGATKAIAVAFGLIGLCLVCEHGYSGRQVQRAHMLLAKKQKQWPRFESPTQLGDIRVHDVLAAEPGELRNTAIRRWAKSVWDSWSEEDRGAVRALIQAYLQ